MDIVIKKTKYSYYYEKDSTEPSIIVCYLLTHIGIVSCGLSICSKRDTYDETIGKAIAERNAYRVLKGRSMKPILRKDAINQLIKTQCPFTKRGEIRMDLSFWEQNLLFKNKEPNFYKKLFLKIIK